MIPMKNSTSSSAGCHVLEISLAALLLLAGVGVNAAVTFSVSPAAITNDFTGVVTFTIGGLTSGKAVLLERFADFNGNSVVDSGDVLLRGFVVTDGQVPLIGGVRNPNVPGDDDGATNSQIRVDLPFPGLDPSIGAAAGSFVWRVSDPQSGFTAVTHTNTVAQKTYPQSVSGQLTSGGQPVANVVVALLVEDGPAPAITTTDASGNYTLYAPPGNYSVIPIKSGLVADLEAGGVSLGANAMVTKNITATAGTLILSGRVTDSGTGVGLPGVFFQADSTNGLFSGTFTDSSGNYTLGITAGGWELEADSAALAQLGYLAPAGGLQTNLTVSATVNLAVASATALIYGTVNDSATNAVGGIGLYANSQGGLYNASGRSFPANGSYALGVSAGDWSVSQETEDLAIRNLGAQGTNLTLTANQAVQVDFYLPAVTAHLRGQIKDDSGAPITNMQIVVQTVPFQAGGAGSTYPMTDGSGNFDAGVRAGTWNINLSCVQAQDRNLIGITTNNFTVIDGVDQNGLVLTFPKATATITGSVKDQQNNPIAGVQLDANAANNDYLVGCVPTDASGNYTLHVLNNLTWMVSVRGGDLNARGFNDVSSQNVNVSGGNGTADFVAASSGGGGSDLQISTASLPNATQGSSYNTSLAASGGQASYTWSISAGFLPSGLLMNSAGQIAGTPGESGSFPFTARVTDATNAVITRSLALVVNAGSFSQPAFTNGVVLNGGQLQIQLAGVAGQTYTLESTADFMVWRSDDTFVMSSNVITFDATEELTRYPLRFYRVRIGRVFFSSLNFHHYANGGNFGAALTPATSFPISLNSYSANFEADNDPMFPAATNVFFTGPGGSGLSNQAANPGNSNVAIDSSRYQSPNVSSPAIAPGGTWTIGYHGTNLVHALPDPQAASRLVIPLPTVTLSGNNLQSVSWDYRNPTSGASLGGPASFMTDVQVQVEDMNLGRVYDSPNVVAATSHTLTNTVNWTTVIRMHLVYNDTLGNHYVVSFNKP